jgi:hypothetical protein
MGNGTVNCDTGLTVDMAIAVDDGFPLRVSKVFRVLPSKYVVPPLLSNGLLEQLGASIHYRKGENVVFAGAHQLVVNKLDSGVRSLKVDFSAWPRGRSNPLRPRLQRGASTPTTTVPLANQASTPSTSTPVSLSGNGVSPGESRGMLIKEASVESEGPGGRQ